MTLCIIGKTCSGKDTIVKELEKQGIKRIVTYTTREPRDGEVDGVDYHFLTDKEFDTLIDMGHFATTVGYPITKNLYWRFGTAKEDIVGNKCIITDPEQLEYFKSLNEVLIVYLYADNEIMWNRLRQRGTKSEEARRRVDSDSEAFANILDDVDLAVKNNGDKDPSEIAALIKCWWDFYEKKKSQAALEEIKKSFENLVFDVEGAKWSNKST